MKIIKLMILELHTNIDIIILNSANIHCIFGVKLTLPFINFEFYEEELVTRRIKICKIYAIQNMLESISTGISANQTVETGRPPTPLAEPPRVL
jgi:hypothetical protein